MTTDPKLEGRVHDLEKIVEENRKSLSLAITLINAQKQQINALMEVVFGSKNK